MESSLFSNRPVRTFEGKFEVGVERGVRDTRDRGRHVSRTPRALQALLRSSEKHDNITPFLHAG